MSLLEIIAALPSVTQIRPFAAPLLIAAILAVHSLYFWVNRASNGQQAISLVDYSQMLGQRIGTGADRMVWVCSDGQELDTVHRRSTPTVLPAKPRRGTRSPGHTRCASRHLVEDRTVATTLICAEDLECAGESLFLNAVKVGGDLIVRGNARFAAPVIVNGVLKIEGRAHFAEGVLAFKEKRPPRFTGR